MIIKQITCKLTKGRFALRAILTSAGLTLISSTPSHAIVCETSFDELSKNLFDKRGQALVFTGKASKGLDTSVFMSTNGTWTMVLEFTDGKYCIISEGKSSELFPRETS